MNYGDDIINVAAFLKGTEMVGPGLRDAIWVQGCSINCRGCANQSYLPHEPRVLMRVSRILEHFKLRKNTIDGISILGGEPTEQPDAVGNILHGVKLLGLSTVLFTGRTHSELKKDFAFDKILKHTDLLIDGPFILRKQNCSLQWRGSKNQRLIFLTDRLKNTNKEKKTANGEVILSDSVCIFHGIGIQNIKL